jgi:hypothetical protein
MPCASSSQFDFHCTRRKGVSRKAKINEVYSASEDFRKWKAERAAAEARLKNCMSMLQTAVENFTSDLTKRFTDSDKDLYESCKRTFYTSVGNWRECFDLFVIDIERIDSEIDDILEVHPSAAMDN